MPLTNQRSPEQWATLIAEVQAAISTEEDSQAIQSAKQARNRLEAAKRAALRKGKRELRQKIELVRVLASRLGKLL